MDFDRIETAKQEITQFPEATEILKKSRPSTASTRGSRKYPDERYPYPRKNDLESDLGDAGVIDIEDEVYPGFDEVDEQNAPSIPERPQSANSWRTTDSQKKYIYMLETMLKQERKRRVRVQLRLTKIQKQR
jgi:hypothetical protein